MESMNKLKKMLSAELEEITKRGDVTHSNLETIYKLVVAIEKLCKIEQMDGEEEYSQRGRYSRTNGNSYGESYRGESYRNDSYGNHSYNDSYGEGDSYRSGMHYVRGHYSRAGEDMGQKLEEMMHDPNVSQKDKETLRKAVELLDR